MTITIDMGYTVAIVFFGSVTIAAAFAFWAAHSVVYAMTDRPTDR